MIRTVLGDIPISSITGNVLTHEHIQNVSSDMLRCFGKHWLDEDKLTDYAIEVFRMLRETYHVALFVDGTPCDLGRNSRQLQKISENTGISIVASTGLYHYPSLLTCTRSAEKLAEIFLAECEHGMEGTDIRPGILKCATDLEGLTPDNRKRVAALGITQRETGLPLYAHCRHVENTAHEMLDILSENGTDVRKVVLGHATNRLDADYLTGLLKRGCYIGLDQCFPGREKQVAEIVVEMCRRGYEDKLLFSLDSLLYNDFSNPSHDIADKSPLEPISRYGFLFDTMLTAFREAGCTDKQLKQFVVANPLCFLNIQNKE